MLREWPYSALSRDVLGCTSLFSAVYKYIVCFIGSGSKRRRRRKTRFNRECITAVFCTLQYSVVQWLLVTPNCIFPLFCIRIHCTGALHCELQYFALSSFELFSDSLHCILHFILGRFGFQIALLDKGQDVVSISQHQYPDPQFDWMSNTLEH